MTKKIFCFCLLVNLCVNYVSSSEAKTKKRFDGAPDLVDIIVQKANYAFVACDSSSNIMVFYSRLRSLPNVSYMDLFTQRFTSNGLPLGIEDTVTSTYWAIPSDLVMNPNGSFIVAWDNYPDVLFRGYDANDNPMFDQIAINPPIQMDNIQNLGIQIASNGKDKFPVVWDYNNWPYSKYISQLQLFTSNGVKFGDTINFTPNNCNNADVAMAPDGSYTVVWSNGNDSHIYMRRFTPSGEPSGIAIVVDSVGVTSYVSQKISVGMDAQANIAVVWAVKYPNRDNSDIYLQRFDRKGVRLGTNIIVNDDSLSASHQNPSLSIAQTGAIVIVWRDSRRHGTFDVYGQRFNPDGGRFGNNFCIANYNQNDFTPSVATNNQIIACSWQDTSKNIHIIVFPWNQEVVASVKFKDDNFHLDNFILNQNYPNPFNPTTIIKFSLSKSSFSSLKIFDALGNEISTLVNGELSAGNYSKEWNASKYPSGVYFYRLQTDRYMQTKKMLLVK